MQVDDGVPSRGHRLAVFDDGYNMAGVAVGAHAVFGNMVAIEFATKVMLIACRAVCFAMRIA